MIRVLFFVISIFAIGAITASFFRPDNSVTYVTLSSGEEVRVEVADEPTERTRGLSGRDGLAENEGLLIDFDGTELSPGIWMKDMKFPIDILWLADGQIVWIVEHAPVPEGDDIASYLPPVEATHVLELPAGFVAAHEVKLGDFLTIGN